eukprot:gnl/TRDRNA2_/TRDRNA2_163852_c3_seq1.p1 gnl/TRDRNA2_/TRDRNA2_163852_c3~~gnl/TRDRNA2_/TRDRNA2_163852_c3_seq1.p1  ORF type:complete len:524 (+),score=95.22 gnl/TRDRNA2_/TRDRNA2_163852_c3_seq1:48-1574(+)
MAPALKAAVRPGHYEAFSRLLRLACAAPAEVAGLRAASVKAALGNGAGIEALDVRGFTLLDMACYCCGSKDVVEVLLSAGASVAARGLSHPSALMWAHWMAHEDAVVLLTASGAGLTNADLEGLQRLRVAWSELQEEDDPKKPDSKGEPAAKALVKKGSRDLVSQKVASPAVSPSKAQASAAAESGGGSSSTALMLPDMSHLWLGGAPCSGILVATQGLRSRMAWGMGIEAGAAAATAPEVPELPSTVDFLKSVEVACEVGILVRTKLFAMRRVAEGSGLGMADLVVLQMFLADRGFHDACCAASSTLAAHQPVPSEAEKAADLHSANARLFHALKAIPATKVMCYRASRMATGGTLRELLRGHRHALDCYRPGSIVLWRHAVSVTTDPVLAEEIALRGEPVSGCGIVFKIRRAIGARPVSEFAEYPEHGEMIFPAGSVFRVVGLFPCTERCIRRGAAADGGPWSFDVGISVQRSDALTWEDACRARNVVVLLDEEEPSALQRIDLAL